MKKIIYISIALFIYINAYSINFNKLKNNKKQNNNSQTINESYLDNDLLSKSNNIKLSPYAYDTIKEYDIPSIPLNLIQNFIEYPKILSQKEIIKSPKIFDNPNGKKLLATGDIIYSTDITESGNYLIYREGKKIMSPQNKKKTIGTEIEIIGEAATIEPANSSTNKNYFKNEYYTKKGLFNIRTILATPLIITKARTEIKNNDKLYKLSNLNKYERFNFTPHLIDKKIKANIFHIYKGLSNLQYSKFSNIVISCGEKNGIDKGTILSLYKNYPLNKTVRINKLKNPINNSDKIIKYVSYPTQEIGKAMVYYVEKNISYAIIIESYGIVEIGDIVSNTGRNLEEL